MENVLGTKSQGRIQQARSRKKGKSQYRDASDSGLDQHSWCLRQGNGDALHVYHHRSKGLLMSDPAISNAPSLRQRLVLQYPCARQAKPKRRRAKEASAEVHHRQVAEGQGSSRRNGFTLTQRAQFEPLPPESCPEGQLRQSEPLEFPCPGFEHKP